jgi:hypothetical protein
MYTYISNDGLLKSNSKYSVDNWNDIIEKSEMQKQKYIELCKKMGLKLAHPNDGWVDRENNILTISHPYFKESIKVGDLIGLGFYWEEKPLICEVLLTDQNPSIMSGNIINKVKFKAI